MGKKGGGTTVATTNTTQSYDPVASKKLAEIAERQQEMAEEQWDMYKDYFQEYEIAAAKTNVELLPYVSAASKATLEEQTRDIEKNQPIKDAMRDAELKGIARSERELEMADPIAEKFYKESEQGVDLGKRADSAGANVIAAMRAGRGSEGRELSRYGIDPGSSRFKSGLSDKGVSAAMLIGGVRNKAVSEGETENYNRLYTALGVRGSATGLPGIQSTQGQNQTTFGDADPASRAMSGLNAAASSYAPLASRVLSSTGTTTKPSDKSSFWDFAGNVLGQAAGAYVGGAGYAAGAKAFA